FYWDDDLFGYMRAPSKKAAAVEKRSADASRASETPTTDTVTRVSPFRVSTLVSIAPVNLTEDFGTMSRHEGDPVPHEHQFYRTTLKGLFSLDLGACGTFSYRRKTGYRNLDDERIEQAKREGLEHRDEEKSYRLAAAERIQRISTLFDGLAQLEGGAKQALHYTDVAPAVTIMAVTKGGNHIFGHVIGATGRGLPEIKIDALQEALTVFKDEILSDVYVGWVKGYLDDERSKLEAFAQTVEGSCVRISHPREAFRAVAEALRKEENLSWLD
ncbi:MAG: type I-B CRISPR-associated protein Cas7/Cst2/DevR, partial [Anaerolineae bacterium]|nr:type I-B CRISPR-associated protein Cas7/Cst2/DevR [Anaerolineae bacterium]